MLPSLLNFLYIVLPLLVFFSVKMVKKRCWSWCADLRNPACGGLHRQQAVQSPDVHRDSFRFMPFKCFFFTWKSSKDQIKSTNQRKHAFIVNYHMIKKNTSACARKKLTFLGEVSNILTSREGLGDSSAFTAHLPPWGAIIAIATLGATFLPQRKAHFFMKRGRSKCYFGNRAGPTSKSPVFFSVDNR